MKVELHTTPDVFDTLAEEWKQLLDTDRSDVLFLLPEYQRIWWSHLGRGNLALLSIRDNGGVLRGIAPWLIEQKDGARKAVFIGAIDVSDYLDFPVESGYEQPVFEAIIDFMQSDLAPAWDRIELNNIPHSSPTIGCLEQIALSRQMRFEMEKAEVCPVIDLPDSYEQYLEQLDKKQRHELRRKRRRAEESNAGWYAVNESHDLDQEIDRFLDLMALSTSEKADFLTESGHRSFFRELGHAMAKLGLLNLIFLTVENRPAATMWQFTYKDRLLLYNSGMNQVDYGSLSPGIVLLAYGIEAAIEQRLRKYDFLRGDEQYKYRMGAVDATIYTICLGR